jgi:macrolide transport system ATP-binding/permease protein
LSQVPEFLHSFVSIRLASDNISSLNGVTEVATKINAFNPPVVLLRFFYCFPIDRVLWSRCFDVQAQWASIAEAFMRTIRVWLSRFGDVFNRHRTDRDLAAELESHLQFHIDDNLRAGMAPEEARRQALIQLGGLDQTKESVRDRRGLPSLESFLQDVRFGVRMLRKNPGFTAVAVLTLALGIGGNTAIFTLVQGILLRSLPVSHPSQLYRVGDRTDCCYYNGFQNPDGDFDLFSYDLYHRFQESAPEFEQLAALQAGGRAYNVRSGGSPAKQLGGEYVSGNYFSTLGVGALAGRPLNDSDDTTGAAPAIVLSYQSWQTNFAGDPGIVGSTVNVEMHPFVVAGIAPPGFFGDRVSPAPPDFWMPLASEPLIEGANSSLLRIDQDWLYVLGRVRPDTNLVTLQSKLSLELREWLDSRPNYTNSGGSAQIPKQHVVIVPAGGGIQQLQQQTGAGLRMLMVLSMVILLIACANIANLLLARGAARRADVALRVALGAVRARLVRQTLTESVLLALLGGAAGLPVAYFVSKMLLVLAFPKSPNMPVHATAAAPVLAFAFVVSLLTGVIFGVMPAWISSRAHPADALRSSGRTTHEPSSLPQRALAVFQMAVSVLLVAAAFVSARSLRNLERQNVGFATVGRYVAQIDPKGAGYNIDELPALYQKMEDAFSASPGVVNVSFSRYVPLAGYLWGGCVVRQGYSAPRQGERCFSSSDRVSPQFLDSIGVPILRGRGFTAADVSGGQSVVIVNEAFARQFFPSEDPIGRHFGMEPKYASAFEIVGVFADFKMNDPRMEAQPLFLRPLAQRFTGFVESDEKAAEASSMFAGCIIFDFARPQKNAEELIRSLIARIDPNLTVFGFDTYDAKVGANFNQDRLIARLTTMFGMLALVLASVGLYGLMSYSVGNRTNEIGIRMALGAERGGVVRMILYETLLLAAIGICVGVPLVLGTARLAGSELAGLLFKVSATSASLVLLACAVLAGSAALAGYLPARRASRVDPMVALRHE